MHRPRITPTPRPAGHDSGRDSGGRAVDPCHSQRKVVTRLPLTEGTATLPNCRQCLSAISYAAFTPSVPRPCEIEMCFSDDDTVSAQETRTIRSITWMQTVAPLRCHSHLIHFSIHRPPRPTSLSGPPDLMPFHYKRYNKEITAGIAQGLSAHVGAFPQRGLGVHYRKWSQSEIPRGTHVVPDEENGLA